MKENLAQIGLHCRNLECNFTIDSDWIGTKDKPQFRFGWRIESSRRRESSAKCDYSQLEDCVLGCLMWLSKVKKLRGT